MEKTYYLYYDFETGGLQPGVAEPVEFAAILLDAADGSEVSRWESGLMKVQRPENLHPRALEVNGYSVEEIMAGRDAGEAFQEFADWLAFQTGGQAVHPSGHNVAFDIGFMQWAFKEYLPGLDYYAFFNDLAVDTKDIAKRMLVGIPVYEGNKTANQLTNITAHYGIPHDAHKAMPDVEAGVEVLRRLWDGIEKKVARNHYIV